MSGFLDEHAASIEAEYTRYLDADILGKIVFKNFALNVLGIEKDSISIPLSRHAALGAFDAGIVFENRLYRAETKISRWIVQKRNKVNPILRWSFSGLKRSAKGTERGKYDLVFAVGINAPGLEDSREYWRHFDSLRKAAKNEGRVFGLSAWPHEREFLNHCGIFILPRQFIFAKYPNTSYVTIRTIPERRDYEFFGWGYDIPRLRQVWNHAIKIANTPTTSDSSIK